MKKKSAISSFATLASLVSVAGAQAVQVDTSPAQTVSSAAPAAQAPAQAGSSPTRQVPAPGSGQNPPAPTVVTTVNGARVPGQVIRTGPAMPAKPPKPPWQEFKLDKKKTMFLDFTDSNPDMIISMFSRTSGITIIKDPSFKSTLTVQSAKEVHLDEAFQIFNTVLKLNGYELQKDGDLMVVGKKVVPPPPQPMPQPAPTPPPAPDLSIVQVYPLQNANAAQVARVVNEVFSPQQLQAIVQQLQQGGGFQGQPQQFGGQPQGPQLPKIIRASSDEYSNSVVVNAPQKDQDEVKKLITQLDKTTDQPLESQVFRLKFVNVDEVVDAVKEVLTANAPTGRGGGKPQDNNQNQFYYGYRAYGSQNSSTSGAQSAISIKQTNSLIVAATKENMVLVKKLLDNLDSESNYVGTTTVIRLENAKATDVATMLNTAFTKRRDQSQSDNPYFLVYSDYPDQQKKSDITTDLDEHGQIVNVRDLTGKVNIVADPNTNSLVIVTMPSNIKLIKKVIDAIDTVSEQVMIETIIVEANLDKTTKLGVEWNFLQNSVLGKSNTTATTTSDFGLQTNPLPSGARYTLTAPDYKAFVNALQTNNRYKILSTPRVFTSNNVKAKIDVSQQYPYATSQQTTVATTGLISNFDYKTIGVVLTVTPRITSAGEVSMDVDQTADDLQGLSSFGAPIINHREASTIAFAKDGETILLGGIIRSSVTNNVSKVPLLGDIPFLGHLFQSSSKENQQTELMVLLTPHIVKAPAGAVKIRELSTKDLSKESQEAVNKLIQKDKE